MIPRRAAGLLALGLAAACHAPAPPPPASFPALPVIEQPAAEPAPAPPEPDPACQSDADCGFDPSRDSCRNDPRANRQPLLIDQGIVCFCEKDACATLRVPPVACELDSSCAVREAPRPHPVAASAEHPHERGKPCRDFKIATTCERTNICTMHRLRCKGP